MSANKKDACRQSSDVPVVRVDWTVGLRTSAWDRLWNMILSDLGPPPAGDVHERLESESDDA